MTNDILSDNRRKRHIYMDSKLDDLPLTMEAYRVYCHLCRRAGCDNNAFPSYKSIGEACFRGSFPNSPTDSLRRKAIAAVNELIFWNLITKTSREKEGLQTSNHYNLTDMEDWYAKPTKLSSLIRGTKQSAPNAEKMSGAGGTPPSVGGTPQVVLGEHPSSVGGTPQVVLGEHPGSVGGTPKDYPIEDYPVEVYPVKREEQHSPSPDFSPNDEISSPTPHAQRDETDFSTPLPHTQQPNSNFSSSLSNSESLHQNENTSSGSIVPGSFENIEQTNLANSSTVVTDSLSSRNAAKLQRYQQLDAEGIKLKQPELRDWARLEIGNYVRTYRKSGFILTGGNDVSGEFAVYVAKQNCRKGQQPTIALGFNVINKCEQDPRSWQKLVVWVTEWQQLRQTGQQVNVAAVVNQQQQIERIRQAANTKFEL